MRLEEQWLTARMSKTIAKTSIFKIIAEGKHL